jgi:hypothetical protein
LNSETQSIEVVIEAGSKRIFASARGWPGWSRSAPDEAATLRTLFEYGPRYERVMQRANIAFSTPADVSQLVVAQRLTGDASTDFGVPRKFWEDDRLPVSPPELEQYRNILRACWAEFDQTVSDSAGMTLRKGPRGGGRGLAQIVDHVYEVDGVYLASLGGKPTPVFTADLRPKMELLRKDILFTLDQSVRGLIPERGPKGGVRWTARYFVRRLAWHELDHAWEIASRAE